MPEKSDQRSAFKECLMAIVGMPPEAAIAKFGKELTEEQATYLRNLKDEDVSRMKATENELFSALGESGGGCGVYN